MLMHQAMEIMEAQAADGFGRFTTYVDDFDIGPVGDAAAGGLHAAAEIDFLVVEEEAGIEVADGREHVAADDGEGAGNPVGIGGLFGVGPGTVGPAEEAGGAEAGGEAGEAEAIVEE